MAECWICESASSAKSHSRHRGACSTCGERLRKKFGSGQWEAVAREAIACGNRQLLLSHVMCRNCGKTRVSVNKSKTLLCDKCRDKVLRQEMTEEQREEFWQQEYRRKLASKRRSVLRQRELAKQLRGKINAVSAVPPDDPYRIALAEARKNPARRVIPVAMGGKLVGVTLYFEPYLDREGVLQVREMRGV